MSSKDRKHSSKGRSDKHKPSAHGDREIIMDKEKKKSDKLKPSSDKGSDLIKEKLEYKYKLNSADEHRKDKREKEERNDEKRKHRTNDERHREKADMKAEMDYEEERRRRHEEKKRQRKLESNESGEKRKHKSDVYEDFERVKNKSDHAKDRLSKERSDDYKDTDKRKHRSDRDSKEEHRKKKQDIESMKTEENEKMRRKLSLEKESDPKRKHNQKEISQMVDKKNKEKSLDRGDEIVTNRTETIANRKQIVEEDTNYDDDFENFDEEERDENIETGIQLEGNAGSPASFDRVATESSSLSHSSRELSNIARVSSATNQKQPPKIGQIHSSFINFHMAQKKYSHNLVANKMLGRAFDLCRLIDLDRVDYDIIDIAPILKHSQYMQLFGKEGCQHEGCQTGDDNVGRESQTEPIEFRVIWTQYPPQDDSDSFQIVYDSEGSHSLSKQKSAFENTDLELMNQSDNFVSLSKLLSLMETILEEEASLDMITKVPASGDGKHAISIGYNKYDINDRVPCLIGRFAASNSNMFVTVHEMATSTRPVDKQDRVISPIAVWKVSASTNQPYIYLTSSKTDDSKSNISCVTFSPDPAASHVICGLKTGAIALWDLREYSHGSHFQRGLPPSYFTSASLDDGDSFHKGSIIALQPVVTGTSMNSYQLISVDSFAQLFVWMISAVTHRDQWTLASGSLTDLNLRPGARFRLSKLASIPLASHLNSISEYYVTATTVDPSSNYNLFLGTNGGQIIHIARANRKVFHNSSSFSHFKIIGDIDLFLLGAVTQLDFYPFFEPYLLAGHDDGLIQLFSIGKSKCLLSFLYKQNVPVLQLKWSRSHPAVFFSLCSDGSLCVWNVLVDIYKPVHIQKFANYVGFDLSIDSKWQLQDKSLRNNKARLLLWSLDGQVEVHELSKMYSEPELDDGFKTCALFQSLT